MTATCSSPILPPTTSYIHHAPYQPAFQPQARLVGRRLEATAKEGVVGDEQEDYYAARRAALERHFQELPPADTTEYWQRIEQATKETSLRLEVLVRCLRERWNAGAHQHAKRIFEYMVKRIQSRTKIWAWGIACQCHTDQSQMHQDLQQTCYMALWEELADDGPTFLIENFLHAFDRIQRHVAHALMEKAGEWKRSGVETPTRIQQQAMLSLNESVDSEEELTLEEILGDQSAQAAFEQAEQSSDILPLLNKLPPHLRMVLYDRVWRGFTEDEIARKHQVTDRTVRNRLKQARTLLRTWYFGGEEDNRG